VPQKGLGGKTIKQIQGKVLGGSSAINVQGWTRGPAADL
jgi:choline dehydrogenase-like flavoprotein